MSDDNESPLRQAYGNGRRIGLAIGDAKAKRLKVVLKLLLASAMDVLEGAMMRLARDWDMTKKDADVDKLVETINAAREELARQEEPEHEDREPGDGYCDCGERLDTPHQHEP